MSQHHITGEEVVETSRHFLDRIVSLIVYIVAIILVGYMLGTIVRDLIDFWSNFGHIISAKSDTISLQIQKDLLHTIAFTIVLAKAYRLLMSYAKTHHLNIEFLIKLAIASPIVEILFNNEAYEFRVLIAMGVFALVNLVIYLYFYTRIRKIVKDHVSELSHHERG